jgi:hypothetical protein
MRGKFPGPNIGSLIAEHSPLGQVCSKRQLIFLLYGGGHLTENLVNNWTASCVSMECLNAIENVSAKKATVQRYMCHRISGL